MTDIDKAEAILRTPLTMPVTEHQLQNREWARGVLADEWMDETPITCPTCNGDKVIIGMFPVYAEHVPQADRKAAIEMICPTCKGVGAISSEHVDRIAAGERLREKRKAAILGLRHAAQMIGILPSDLSYAEQGAVSLEEIAAVERLLDVFIVGRDALIAKD